MIDTWSEVGDYLRALEPIESCIRRIILLIRQIVSGQGREIAEIELGDSSRMLSSTCFLKIIQPPA